MLSTTAAVLFLVAVVAAPLAAVAWGLAKSALSPTQCLLWAVAYLLVKFLWRTRWEGKLAIADGQGAVIVCNHRSSVDPFFLQTATGRKIHWMVAREYCEHPAFRWFLTTCEVIPTGRGGIDTAATKAALRIVEQGGLVGMFPEGRINRTGDLLLPIRPGAAHIALRTGVPLLPCYIAGSPYRLVPWSPLLMRAHVVVQFGQPIKPSRSAEQDSDSEASGDLMRQCMAEIARLAGQADFQPEFAGRNWKPTAEELARMGTGSSGPD